MITLKINLQNYNTICKSKMTLKDKIHIQILYKIDKCQMTQISLFKNPILHYCILQLKKIFRYNLLKFKIFKIKT